MLSLKKKKSVPVFKENGNNYMNSKKMNVGFKFLALKMWMQLFNS